MYSFNIMSTARFTNEISFRDLFDYIGSVLDLLGLNFCRDNWHSSKKTNVIFVSVLFSYFLNFNAGLNALDDYQEVIYAVIAISSGIIGVPKVYTILRHHEILRYLKDVVVNEASYSADDTPQERKLKVKYSRLSGKVTRLCKICYGCGGISVMILPLFVRNSWMLPKNHYAWNTLNRKHGGLSHPGYDIHYILMVLFVLYAMILYIAYDVCFYYFAAFIAYKTDLCVYYSAMLGNFNSEFDSNVKQKILLNKIANLHIEIISFIKHCSNVFFAVVCFQPIAAMSMMTVCLFNVHVNPYNWSYACLMSVVAQFFIYCYCGELVLSKVQNASKHLYCSQWYKLRDTKDRKQFMYILMHSQRDMSFSAYGLYDLSFATYARLLKATFGYVAFLQNVL